jgi:DnaJ-class molecular chaperone
MLTDDDLRVSDLDLSEETREYDDDGPVGCKWCSGRGTISVEPGGSLCYRCPDCNGTGKIIPDEDEAEDAEGDEE